MRKANKIVAGILALSCGFITLASPLSASAATCSSVCINSVELVSKSDLTTENSEASFQDLDVSVDLSMSQVGDNAKYKVNITNNTSKEYTVQVGKTSDANFSYEASADSKLNANSTGDVIITISYIKEVPEASYVDNRYTTSVSVPLVLQTGVTNPKTLDSIQIAFIGLAISGIVIAFVFRKNTRIRNACLAIAAVPMIAVSTQPASANDSITIKLNADITLVKILWMQDVAQWRDTLTLEQEVTAYDRRDNKPYTVALLADGNVWMTQNLALELDKDRTYTPADTNITSNWKPATSTITNLDNWIDYDEDTTASYNSGNRDEGVYYNWNAAAAINNIAPVFQDNNVYNTMESICPSGWTLPGVSNEGGYSFMDLMDEYDVDAWGEDKAAVDNMINTIPLKLKTNGVVEDGNKINQVSIYWQNYAQKFAPTPLSVDKLSISPYVVEYVPLYEAQGLTIVNNGEISGYDTWDYLPTNMGGFIRCTDAKNKVKYEQG